MAEAEQLTLTLPEVLRAIVRGDAALLNSAGWQQAALKAIGELEDAAAGGGRSSPGKGKAGGDGS